jgi:hypothetical protein
VPREDSKHHKRRSYFLPAAFLAMIALYLLFPTGSGAAMPDVRDYLHLAAQTGLWLGAAWLGKRLLSAVVLSYSARKARSGTTTFLVSGGS